MAAKVERSKRMARQTTATPFRVARADDAACRLGVDVGEAREGVDEFGHLLVAQQLMKQRFVEQLAAGHFGDLDHCLAVCVLHLADFAGELLGGVGEGLLDHFGRQAVERLRDLGP